MWRLRGSSLDKADVLKDNTGEVLYLTRQAPQLESPSDLHLFDRLALEPTELTLRGSKLPAFVETRGQIWLNGAGRSCPCLASDRSARLACRLSAAPTTGAGSTPDTLGT